MEVIELTATSPRIVDDVDATDSTALWLKDIVDIEALQRIQDTFAKAMGLAAVTVDRVGNPVTRASNFQPICQLIRSTRAGLIRCQKCDARGGLAAYLSGKTETYICMSGLMDAAAPIIIEGEYLGCILCGQVVMADDQERFINDVIERNLSLGLPREQLLEAVLRIPAIPRERLDAAVEMLSLAANQIVGMGITNLTQARLLQEAREKATMENALRDAQLRALQAQINPHFLFNALTLVSYTAFEENAPRTEEIAYILSDLLRYSLRNTATTVTLAEEIEMIGRYLSLQQMRFGERLHQQIEIDACLDQLPVPCMILQPLVENAIVHSVEAVTESVTVRVCARHVGDMVVIEVADDGVGMPAAQVQALHEHRVKQNEKRKRPSLGLQSVITRLEGEYGDAFGIHVESAPGQGTCITISWPVGLICFGDSEQVQHDAALA